MAYIGKSPQLGVRSRFYFTATGGETSLSGASDSGATLLFTDGNYVDVSLNGVALVADTDYNTTTANTIGGLAALSASDIVEVIVYDVFSVADSLTSGGTINGGLTVSGTAALNEVTFNKAVPGNTQTSTLSSDTELDFDTYQNFILTLSASITLSNQSADISDQIGQSGFIIFVQGSSGGPYTVSPASDYVAAGGSLNLSSTADAIDMVPYVIQADNKILLGTPQLAFAAVP
jgi:hypothetical protein